MTPRGRGPAGCGRTEIVVPSTGDLEWGPWPQGFRPSMKSITPPTFTGLNPDLLRAVRTDRKGRRGVSDLGDRYTVTVYGVVGPTVRGGSVRRHHAVTTQSRKRYHDRPV